MLIDLHVHTQNVFVKPLLIFLNREQLDKNFIASSEIWF